MDIDISSLWCFDVCVCVMISVGANVGSHNIGWSYWYNSWNCGHVGGLASGVNMSSNDNWNIWVGGVWMGVIGL